jgi:hypothetical protein
MEIKIAGSITIQKTSPESLLPVAIGIISIRKQTTAQTSSPEPVIRARNLCKLTKGRRDTNKQTIATVLAKTGRYIHLLFDHEWTNPSSIQIRKIPADIATSVPA